MYARSPLFTDRVAGGSALARALQPHVKGHDALVLALPRGGVPVGDEVALQLGLPLDVFVVRKLGAPSHHELAMGALASGGVTVFNEDVLGMLRISEADIRRVEAKERAELSRREALYRGSRPAAPVSGRAVVVVDDGLATGATMRVAVKALRKLGAARIVAAAPVGSREARDTLAQEADACVVVSTPEPFDSVGRWYESFEATEDAEVCALLERAWAREAARLGGRGASGPRSVPVEISCDHVTLAGELVLPAAPRGLVVFAHGSGSSRHSPRNQRVARRLQESGLATLLFDLLTPSEGRDDESTAALRFDIGLLGRRVCGAVRWASREPALTGLRIGIFGASTGAAAALVAAARERSLVRAVVSRGGRPDLAGAALPLVSAPTLLIVGGEDGPVIALNRQAMSELVCPVELKIVPHATHLFEEPGALDAVAGLAADWFARHLSPDAR